MCACTCVPVYCLRASRIPHVGWTSPHQWGEGVSAAVAAHLTSLPLIKVNCYDIPSSNKDCLKLWPVTIPLKTRVLKLRLSPRLSWKKKNLPANAGGTRDSIPWLGRSPGEGNGNPLQYSCLENSMDEGAWSYSPWGHKESGSTE